MKEFETPMPDDLVELKSLLTGMKSSPISTRSEMNFIPASRNSRSMSLAPLGSSSRIRIQNSCLDDIQVLRDLVMAFN